MQHRQSFMPVTFALLLFLAMAAGPARSDADRFHYPPLGWSMPIPSGWVLEHEGAVAEYARRGSEMMGLDPAELTQQQAVVSMKNGIAVFAAALDPKPMAQLSPDLHREMFELSVNLASATLQRNIPRVEVVTIASARIGDRDFLLAEFLFYADIDPKSAPIVRMMMFQSVTERHLFTVTYAAPPEMFDPIDQAWRTSRFGKEARAVRR